MSRGLYIHVPFCRSKCTYCDFYSLTGIDNHRQYLSGLQQELQLHRGQSVATVFFGGGTPSLLTASELSAVLDMVSRYLLLDPSAEVTMEANPGTLNRAYLAGCAAAGVNRLSLGVQSFSPQLLQLLGRRHSVADAEQAVHWAVDVGIPHRSLDLIYGIPGQTLADWQQTLQAACQLPIDHLSLYSLEVHLETELGRSLACGELALPDDDLIADCYQLARQYLPTQGLQQYEISNFARPGAACRHNLNYWQNGEYIGIGPGACSYLQGERYCHPPDYPAWLDSLSRGEMPAGERERLEPRASMAETVVLGLRLTAGVDGVSFASRYGLALEQVFGPTIDRLLRANQLVKTAAGYALPEQLLPVANQLLLAFLD